MRTLQIPDDDGVVREARDVHLNWVSPGYFTTMRTPIQVGRDFTWQDTVTSPKTALVNQTMARRYFGNERAVGRRVTLDEATYEIVGVVGDAKYLELRDTVPPTLYFSAFQQDRASGQFVIRTEGRPLAIESPAREIVRAVAPSIAVTKVRSLAEQVDASIVRERMLGVLSGFFAGLGLLLAAVGLYGVMAYMVARRTSEIGIRMALGAKPSLIARMVLREALTLTAGGIVAGTAVAASGLPQPRTPAVRVDPDRSADDSERGRRARRDGTRGRVPPEPAGRTARSRRWRSATSSVGTARRRDDSH